MKKVIVSFDEKATEEEVKVYMEYVEKMKSLGVEVESIGGGIRNPK